MKNNIILYGRHAVLAALQNPNRVVSQILCTKENADELKKYSVKCHVKIVDRKDIDKLLPTGSVHQGFALYCQELENYAIEDIINMADTVENCHVLILDQVSDPQNIGAIIRSASAFNTLALIVQDKNSPQESGAMAKAAAGMLEKLPICRATNLSRVIGQLKNAGFWVIGMDGDAKTTIDKINKTGKNAVVMGSEGKGMRRLIEENCDLIVKLPISNTVESLNVSTAAAIALYELNRSVS